MFPSALKKGWLKGVHFYNQTVISVLIFVIWVCILTPTALIYRMLGKSLLKKKNRKSYFEKPDPFLKNPEKHFKDPF